ncbi:MAG: 5-methyltetrahydrofolate--homocysteine methyltransferase [Pseudomonadota bacterium]
MNSRRVQHPDFFELARRQIMFLDGGMGTQLQIREPTADDFGGAAFEGCNELLCITRPDWIREIHAAYLDAGADGIETNTFGSNEIVLAEYGIPARTYELNVVAARLAREVCDSYTARPTYVIGSIGPGTKLITLGHVDYDTMLKSYRAQVLGLIDGGSDVLLIETAQDIQQIKIAIRACIEAMKERKVKLPVMAQVTVELTGTLLVGSDIQSSLATLEMFPISSIGLNCATGPDEMRTHLQYLSQTAPFMLSCLPNAGLPENVKGQTVYPLGPEVFADKVAGLARTYGVNIVGGCCGTTPDHIRALTKALSDRQLTQREPRFENAVSSLYNAQPMDVDVRPLYVGERTNANGSKLFRDKLKEDDFDGLVQIAKGQLKEGAHILDCCTAYVSRNEVRDMREFLQRTVTQVNIPIMVDSTEVPVIEESLKIVPGKAIVNSINLEDGEDRARQVLDLCRTYGAAVVALTIDEDGMAKTREKKLEIARRIYRIAHEEFGLKPGDIIFDPLTFTLGSGDAEFRKSAIETLEAIRLIKEAMPGVKTILGLSNVSFGLNPWPRRLLNSVMLYHAVEYGLDLAILNASKIIPVFKIPQDERQIFEDLVFDRTRQDYDPLKEVLARYTDKKAGKRMDAGGGMDLPLPQRLANHIIDGDKLGIIPSLTLALKEYKPLEIINNFLLEGMRVVGEKFGAGEMQLPFVLESAEAMKTAVAHLEPFMDRSETGQKKGKILLATVKGDVHDIGKNLVDIILTNNGFEVVNIGIKQPVEAILQKYHEVKPDAIGLSGLLVKSTAIMRTDLLEMTARNVTVPVILGGAALTRQFVEEDCQAAYKGKVYYASDAFEGLRIMGQITGNEAHASPDNVLAGKAIAISKTTSDATEETSKQPVRPRVRAVRRGSTATELTSDGQSSWVRRFKQIPAPPFWGTKVLETPLSTLFPFLDEFALVRTRWQFAKGEMSDDQFKDILESKARPLLNTWRARAEREKLLQPKAVYGYFPCASEGNLLHVFAGPDSEKVITTFDFPRQRSGRRLCISDFYSPRSSGQRDVIAMQLVTMGPSASHFANKLYSQNQYSDYFYFHGLATEMAEAYAEWLHARIRKELKVHGRDSRNIRQLFSQGYQGSRYSFGYPACPDLEDNARLFKCLNATELTAVHLTENFQMVPEQSTCAVISWHPQARYFAT